jgi:hypothetical protein
MTQGSNLNNDGLNLIRSIKVSMNKGRRFLED